MKVAIDARELCGRPTGVGRYLWHLLQAWNELPEASAHRFVLYLPTSPELAGAGFPHPPQHDRPASAPPSRVAPGVQPSLSFSALALDVRTVAGGSGTMWEQVRLPAALRHDRPDVLLAPAYTAPIATTVPTVLTVHDLSFVAHPEWFPVVTRVRRRVLVQLAARRARRVLTDAEFSRRELVERLGISAEKVQVIPLGVARPTVPGTADSREHGPMVLFVGSIFNRRHLPELIRAVAAVACRHPGVRLEIVGDNRTYPVEDHGLVVAEALSFAFGDLRQGVHELDRLREIGQLKCPRDRRRLFGPFGHFGQSHLDFFGTQFFHELPIP